MTLKNKIITALTAIGLSVGTYTIGGLDIECLKAENVIDIQDVRLCVSDEQLAKIKADDVLAIIANDVKPDDVARIVTLSKEDTEQYSKVSDELLEKIDTDTNSQALDELNKSLALEKPEYLQELKATLMDKYKVQGGTQLENYNLYVFLVDQLKQFPLTK